MIICRKGSTKKQYLLCGK